MAHQAGTLASFCSMNHLKVFRLRCWEKSVTGLSPSIKFASAHLYTWVERGTARVRCLAQEHNTMFPARAQTRMAWSSVACANHKATFPSVLDNQKNDGIFLDCASVMALSGANSKKKRPLKVVYLRYL